MQGINWRLISFCIQVFDPLILLLYLAQRWRILVNINSLQKYEVGFLQVSLCYNNGVYYDAFNYVINSFFKLLTLRFVNLVLLLMFKLLNTTIDTCVIVIVVLEFKGWDQISLVIIVGMTFSFTTLMVQIWLQICRKFQLIMNLTNQIHPQPKVLWEIIFVLIMCVATPLRRSVRMTLALPKWGLGSSSGLLKIQNSTAGVKTPRFEVFFIPLKSLEA